MGMLLVELAVSLHNEWHDGTSVAMFRLSWVLLEDKGIGW